MEKKYQVFISSTYEDLKEERKKVQDTILSMNQFPVGMEIFSASDVEQWEIIKESIDNSDYYVLIMGFCYGSIINDGEDAGISYTQKEYKYAVSQGIPVLAFLVDEEKVAVTQEKMEQDINKREKLQKFKNEVAAKRMVKWWTSAEELAKEVSLALTKEINRGKRPGWIRAQGLNIEKMQAELIEISKENRMLREENEKLKKSIEVRKPDLKLQINGTTNFKIPFFEGNFIDIDCDYMELSMEDVPDEARHMISQEMLDKYNKELPSKEVIENYKNERRFYEQAKQHPFVIELKVCNDGSMKARDIHIEVCFPKEIVVFKKNGDKLPIPERPNKGVNPIDKYYNEINPQSGYSEIVGLGHSQIGKLGTSFVSQLNPNRHFYNEDNSISIRMGDLITGYTWTVHNEYILAPKEKGNFEIKCRFMCEEYSEIITQIIDVTVE